MEMTTMNEYRHKSFHKEEEFLDEFSEMGHQASRHLAGQWNPNFECSDTTRYNRDYFSKTGELCDLTFYSAEVFHCDRMFSSVLIHLRSSTRVVAVRIRVRKSDDELIATTEDDRTLH
jgi:hypothetical protein